MAALLACADTTVALVPPDAGDVDGAAPSERARCLGDVFGRVVPSSDTGWLSYGRGVRRAFATVEDGCMWYATQVDLDRDSSVETNWVCNACSWPMGLRAIDHSALAWWGSALFVDRGSFLKSLDCAVRCRGNEFPIDELPLEVVLQPGESAGYWTEQPTPEWTGIDSTWRRSFPRGTSDPGPLDPKARIQLIYPRFERADQADRPLGPPLLYASVCAEQGLYDVYFRRPFTDAAPRPVDPARVLRVPAGTLDAPSMLLERQPTEVAACER